MGTLMFHEEGTRDEISYGTLLQAADPKQSADVQDQKRNAQVETRKSTGFSSVIHKFLVLIKFLRGGML